ncbi:MAG: AtpZ/AtpI family protein [Gelidibacter sp.]|nr:AtpZ/AtpI family protein [Gelidibacter sp.]
MVEDNEHKKKSNQLNSYARFSGLVIQMAAIIGVGTFIGIKLDDKFPNEHNLYTLILSLAAVIVSIYYVIRQIIAASKDNK